MVTEGVAVVGGDVVFVCRLGWVDKQMGGQAVFGRELVLMLWGSRRRRQVWHCMRSSPRRWPCSAGCCGRPGRWCWPCSRCRALHGRTLCFPHPPQSPLQPGMERHVEGVWRNRDERKISLTKKKQIFYMRVIGTWQNNVNIFLNFRKMSNMHSVHFLTQILKHPFVVPPDKRNATNRDFSSVFNHNNNNFYNKTNMCDTMFEF